MNPARFCTLSAYLLWPDMNNEVLSDLGVQEQTDLVELWTVHYGMACLKVLPRTWQIAGSDKYCLTRVLELSLLFVDTTRERNLQRCSVLIRESASQPAFHLIGRVICLIISSALTSVDLRYLKANESFVSFCACRQFYDISESLVRDRTWSHDHSNSGS